MNLIYFIIFFILLMQVEAVYVYSSFWAPLFNPRILNYRVDANFEPDSGKNDTEDYEKKFGRRGEKLIEALGKGYVPQNDVQVLIVKY